MIRLPIRLTNFWSQTPIVRNIVAVSGGTVVAQIIAFAFSPLITRIYGPEAFGVQGVFLALVSVFTPIVALRYPLAIVVAKDGKEVSGLIRLSIALAAAISLTILLILFVFRVPILRLLGAESLGLLIYLLPLALFLVALQDITNFEATRYSVFRVVGIVSSLQALVVNTARVISGLSLPTAGPLVVITSFSFGAQALMLRIGIRASAIPVVKEQSGAILPVLLKYREFPLYRMPADMISAAAQTTPVILLATLYSPSISGYYVLARSVVNLPLNILGSAVGNVFYSRIAELGRSTAPIFPFVIRATLFQIVAPGGATAFAALFFPSLFAFVFGESWRISGEYAQWMALWVICMLANIPAVRALPVIGRQRLHLIFNVLLFTGGLFSLLAGSTYYESAMSSVKLFSIVTATVYFIQITTYLILVRKFDAKM